MRFKKTRKVSYSKDRETERQEVNGQETVVVPASKTLELEFGPGGNAEAWVHEEDFDPETYHRFMRRAVSSSVSSVQATATGSNGCVECPTVKCPACGDNYQCVMTTLTCTECPLTYCALRESSGTDSVKSSGKKDTGAIVGGVVGGVVGGIAICLWLYFFYYKRYYAKNKKKKKALEDEKDSAAAAGAGLLGSKKNKNGSSDYEDSVNAHVGSSAPGSSLAGGDHSSEMGGGSGLKRPNVAGRGSSRNKDIKLLLSDETSSVSTAAASNILPIAYIPGVKVSTSKASLRNPGGLAQNSRRGYTHNTRRNRRTKDDDAKSHITLGSSILGDLDDEGEALDSGALLSNSNTNSNSNKNMDRRAQNKANRLSDIEEDGDSSNGTYTSSSVGSLVSTHELQQTAIRARPNLVQIAEEADEEETEAETVSETKTGAGTPSAQNDDDDEEDDDDSLIIELDVPANHTTTTTTTTTTTNTNSTDSNTGTNVSNSTTRSSPFNDKYEL